MRITALSLAATLVAALAPVAMAQEASAPPGKPSQSEATSQGAAKSAGEEVAVIETRFGKIVFRFFEKDAPKTVENFKKLARQGFYDGTTFHRVVPGFVIQGGDPNSKDDDPSNDGMGGPGYSITAEFNKNKHLHGTVSMARSQDPNSAGSQFFLCLAATPHLDGQYTAFGQVIEGLDVVDKIGAVKTGPGDRPLEKVVMTKVTVATRPATR